VSTPVINNKPLSPVHYSEKNGVHADHGHGSNKTHIPYEGQTTLATFRVAGKPSYENDAQLAKLGGTLKP
jgi:uncharacterized protein (DUF427 family)